MEARGDESSCFRFFFVVHSLAMKEAGLHLSLFFFFYLRGFRSRFSKQLAKTLLCRLDRVQDIHDGTSCPKLAIRRHRTQKIGPCPVQCMVEVIPKKRCNFLRWDRDHAPVKMCRVKEKRKAGRLGDVRLSTWTPFVLCLLRKQTNTKKKRPESFSLLQCPKGFFYIREIDGRFCYLCLFSTNRVRSQFSCTQGNSNWREGGQREKQ